MITWPAQVVNKCVFEHSHGPYGENLYEAGGNLATWQQGITAWMSESSKYTPSNPDYTVSGHFTQVSLFHESIWFASGFLARRF